MLRPPPLSAGSVSLRLYPHDELGAPGTVDELVAQAAAAEAAGFDGVMTSEHHGGFAGYLPNPIQAAGWALEATAQAWAAPCPLLLPLRPAALVAEELAWLAARFPDRVGLGVASGSRVEDFTLMGSTKDDLTARFAVAFATVAAALGARPTGDPGSATELGPLGDDPAIVECQQHPVPLVSAAMSPAAVRRAAGLGAGILLDSLSGLDRARQLIDAYRAAGGRGAAILIRRVWIGDPPTAPLRRQVVRYQGYAEAAAQAHWTGDQLITGADAAGVAAGLADALARSGADALNLRLHAPAVDRHAVREQIQGLADGLVRLRATP